MDNKTRNMVLTAVICVLGPMSLPIGPVPISLTNLAIYVTMYVHDYQAKMSDNGTDITPCLRIL